MTPSLHHLVEDHLKPKWWQLFRKQKFHVCKSYGTWVIYEIPNKCVATGDRHPPQPCAKIIDDRVDPRCNDGCPNLMASDPAFFQKLDEYLASQCYTEEDMSLADKIGPAGVMGPQGPPGPMGPPGPAGSGLMI